MNESSNDALRDLSNMAIEMMRQYRHDVMNDLQLIRGFLQLNKTERVISYIEQAVVRAQKMSLFSELPDSLVAFVLVDAQIRFSLLDLELVSEQEDQDLLINSSTSHFTTIYPITLVQRLRDLLTELGMFAMEQNVMLFVDIDLSSAASIRIHVSGNNEDMDWLEELSVRPTLRTFTNESFHTDNDPIHTEMERMDSGFLFIIQEQK